jgi:hypothetical protein
MYLFSVNILIKLLRHRVSPSIFHRDLSSLSWMTCRWRPQILKIFGRNISLGAHINQNSAGAWTAPNIKVCLMMVTPHSIDSAQAAGTLCCQPQKPVSVPPEAPVSCFVPIMKPRIDQSSGCCLDPVPILTPSHEDAIYVRCRTDSSCSDSQVCIALGEMEQLMRITSRPSAWDAASSTSPSGTQMRVILWDGPRDEVFEEGML